MLLFALFGVLLLRLAERVLFGLLFHEPPRNTRFFDASVPFLQHFFLPPGNPERKIFANAGMLKTDTG